MRLEKRINDDLEKVYVVVKKDGKEFNYKGRTEFDFGYQYKDGSIELEFYMNKAIYIKKDGTLFNYNGKTEFYAPDFTVIGGEVSFRDNFKLKTVSLV